MQRKCFVINNLAVYDMSFLRQKSSGDSKEGKEKKKILNI